MPTTFLPFFILGGMLFGFEEMHTRCLRKSINENGLIWSEIWITQLPNLIKPNPNHTKQKIIDEDDWFLKIGENRVYEDFLGKGKFDLGWLGKRIEVGKNEWLRIVIKSNAWKERGKMTLGC